MAWFFIKFFCGLPEPVYGRKQKIPTIPWQGSVGISVTPQRPEAAGGVCVWSHIHLSSSTVLAVCAHLI
jgi:hypothetical protein